MKNTNEISGLPLPAQNSPGERIWGTLDSFVESGPMLGRKVANSTFLESLLRLDPFDAYHIYLENSKSGEVLVPWLQENFPELLRRGAICLGLQAHMHAYLPRIHYHCMHLPDGVSRFTSLSQFRNALAANIFPITGVTHSLSYARFMPAYLEHLWNGVSPRDAIIVTSESVRLVMDRIFSGLSHRYGLEAHHLRGPRLEKIPLGVSLDRLPAPEERWDSFAPVADGASRAPSGEDQGRAAVSMRARLGIGGEVVFLYFGRICPYSKMDLMPVFSALLRAEKLGLNKKDYVLLLAGWADEGQTLHQALQQYAKTIGIRLIPFIRPNEEERRAIYAAADVFLSPSDNIQESFGLTIAEAGAAGLPVIASDFDGYRDIVVNEESGLLVPTLGFQDTDETDVLSSFWFDNQYHLKLSQACAVNVPAMARAFARLGTDRALRRRLGEAGRKRIVEKFSWDGVIRRYLTLWEELAATPVPPEQEQALRAARHPQLMHFGEYFQGHFSRTLDEDWLEKTVLQRTSAGDALYKGVLPLLQYAGMEHILDNTAMRQMLLAARRPVGAKSVWQSLLAYFASKGPSAFARERANNTLIWALKHDFLECIEQN